MWLEKNNISGCDNCWITSGGEKNRLPVHNDSAETCIFPGILFLKTYKIAHRPYAHSNGNIVVRISFRYSPTQNDGKIIRFANARKHRDRSYWRWLGYHVVIVRYVFLSRFILFELLSLRSVKNMDYSWFEWNSSSRKHVTFNLNNDL